MSFHATPRPAAGALLLLLSLSGLAGGCSQSRTFTIYANPANARLFIDGQERGPGPITQRFEFTGPSDVHHVRAVAPGHEPQTEDIWADTPESVIVVRLKPLGKKIVVTVEPVAAVVKVNGNPVGSGLSAEAEFALDPAEPDKVYTVTAEREGYEVASRTLRGSDPGGYYPLTLRPLGSGAAPAENGAGSAPSPTTAMRPVPPAAGQADARVDPGQAARPNVPPPAPAAPARSAFARDIVIRTEPASAAASIYIDGEKWGDRAVDLRGREFKTDPTGKPLPQQVRAEAPGYEGGTATLRWEDNRREYVIPLGRRKKDVRIVTDPPDALVTLDGKPLKRDAAGAVIHTVTLPPTDAPGQPAAVTARVTVPGDAWEPRDLRIGWDNGRRDYQVKLTPSRTARVPLLRPDLVWLEEGRWRAAARATDTVAVRDTREGNGRPDPKLFSTLSNGVVPDAITVSPDGTRVLYTALAAAADGSIKSSLRLTNSDGTPGPTLPSDGGTLDLTPSFTPDGGKIFFSSDRAANGRVTVWSMSADGQGRVQQVANSSNATLWPTIDSNPQPRLFYESVRKPPESGSEIHVFDESSPVPDRAVAQGARPRPSPRADSVLYTVVDPATGNRDIYMVADQDGDPLAGAPVNLTNTPDVDECDPAWSRNGVRIAFASNAAADEAGARNYDVYVKNVADRKETRVTFNGSHDDSPAWDPAGRTLYFRSNRGGQWGMWTVQVP